jgi:uncharacterized protein (DUF1501 family)
MAGITRRDFLKGLTFVSIGAGMGVKASAGFGKRFMAGDHIMVVIQMSGGNDGLNTVVPYTDPKYYQYRPDIAIAANRVVPLSSKLGLHPQLQPLKSIWESGDMAVIHGVGYPNPDRSHFRAMEIWQTGSPDVPANLTEGWIGKYMDKEGHLLTTAAGAMAIGGGDVPYAMYTPLYSPPSFETPDDFTPLFGDNFTVELMKRKATLRTIYQTGTPEIQLAEQVRVAGKAAISASDLISSSINHGSNSVTYPQSGLGTTLRNVARLISSGIDTRIYYVTIGGFDTHAYQEDLHPDLLQELSGALRAFYDDLQGLGYADKVVLMTFSEFGRRVEQNVSFGTDHGTAAPLFVIGKPVAGGFYGEQPTLSDLDENSDLKFDVDFRQVYATMIQGWMGEDADLVLGSHFDRLGFIS